MPPWESETKRVDMVKMQKLKLGARCDVDFSLDVHSDLIGASHDFMREGRRVTFSLPSRFYDQHSENPDEEARVLGYCENWTDCGHKSSPQYTPKVISFRMVFLLLELTNQEANLLTGGGISSATHDNVRNLIPDFGPKDPLWAQYRSLSNLLTDTLEYWCRIARWKMGDNRIGPDRAGRKEHPGSRYYCTADPLKRLLPFPLELVGSPSQIVDLNVWTKIQNSLAKGENSPLWVDFANEASNRYSDCDFRGAVVDSAIAAEAFIRNRVSTALGVLPKEDKAIRKRIENWGITEILGKFKQISSTRNHTLSEADLRAIRSLFEVRNSILHGRTNLVSKEQALSAITATRHLTRSM